MTIQTCSNRLYEYDPSSNRISMKLGVGSTHLDTLEEYAADTEYDFLNIGMYTIEMTQQCNLRCRYCCYSGDYSGRRHHENTEISYETLESCIIFIKKHTPTTLQHIFVTFYGGEALLCKDKIKWFIEKLCERLPDKTFEFSISTNGLLISEDLVDWVCSSPNIFLTVTIDGNKQMHDRHRISVGGTGSFERIMTNLRSFYEKDSYIFNQRLRFISTVRSITDIIALNDFWMSDPILSGNRPQHISSIIPNFESGDTVSTNSEKFALVYDLALNEYKSGKENILTDELENLVKTIRTRTFNTENKTQNYSTCLNRPEGCFISSTGQIFICERICSHFDVGTVETGFNLSDCMAINSTYIKHKNVHCVNCWARRLCRKCPTILNNDDSHFIDFCKNERMQIMLALKYYCEIAEHKHHQKIKDKTIQQ